MIMEFFRIHSYIWDSGGWVECKGSGILIGVYALNTK